MILNIACAILIVLLIGYAILSVFTLFYYAFFKNAKVIEIFFIYSFITVCVAFFIVIVFKMFPSINIEFKI